MAETKEEDALSKRDFSKVILTLENVLIPPDKLSPTPSMQDGLDSETEMDLRILGCELIQTSGILLKLPQVAMATGQVLFQRFYYSKSFVKHNMEVVAMACINLASKIEEAPRRIRDVVNTFHHIKQVRSGKTISPLILDQNYVSHKNQVIKAERRVLKELGFCVHVKHTHKIVVMYLQALELSSNQKFVQCAWNYMNDSFRTDVFVRFYPETIACACIWLAARQLQIPLPNNPAWFEVFSVVEEDIREVAKKILHLYIRSKPNADKLDQVVNAAKKLHIEQKLKMKGLTSETGTPNSGSRPTTPSKVSPSPMSAIGMKKVKSEDDQSDRSFGDKLEKKKRSRSGSRGPESRSRSRTPHSRSKSRSYSSRSRSRSYSRSPKNRRKYSPPTKKYKKSGYSYKDDYNKGKQRQGRKHVSPIRSGSRSYSRSPEYRRSPDYKHSYKNKHYKEKHRSRSRSYSRSPLRVRGNKKYKDRYRSRSRSRSYERGRGKTKKHNGHHRSGSRDRYRR